MKTLLLSIYDGAYGFCAATIVDNTISLLPQNEVDEWESHYMMDDQSLIEPAFQQGYDCLIICEDGDIRYYDKKPTMAEFAIVDTKTENIKVR